MNALTRLACLLVLVLALGAGAQDRMGAVRGAYGTYNAPPRSDKNHVDIPQLLQELRDLRVNTHNWLIWHGTNDWAELKSFLPLARKENIRVWVTLVPPSESPPLTRYYSEPFRVDYARWAEEIAKLSVTETNLVAWSIDDFTHNLKFFTPAKMKEISAATRAINPRLAFVPCSYFKQVRPDFASLYGAYVDGILFPYRAESRGANLQDATALPAEMTVLRERLGKEMPVILDIYATAHSRLGTSTAEYVRETMKLGREHCDGVMIYCYQSPKTQPEKNAVLRDQFSAWQAMGAWTTERK